MIIYLLVPIFQAHVLNHTETVVGECRDMINVVMNSEIIGNSLLYLMIQIQCGSQ